MDLTAARAPNGGDCPSAIRTLAKQDRPSCSSLRFAEDESVVGTVGFGGFNLRTVLSVGAAVWRDGPTVTAARLVLGGVASGPIRLSASEAALTGRALDVAAIADAAAGPSRPMDNTDFSFLWRKEMTKNFVGAALGDLV